MSNTCPISLIKKAIEEKSRAAVCDEIDIPFVPAQNSSRYAMGTARSALSQFDWWSRQLLSHRQTKPPAFPWGGYPFREPTLDHPLNQVHQSKSKRAYPD